MTERIARLKAYLENREHRKNRRCLTEEELAYYRRGKNAHVHAVPKGASPMDYAKATGLEALFGYLYLSGQTDRINQLFHIMMEE